MHCLLHFIACNHCKFLKNQISLQLRTKVLDFLVGKPYSNKVVLQILLFYDGYELI